MFALSMVRNFVFPEPVSIFKRSGALATLRLSSVSSHGVANCLLAVTEQHRWTEEQYKEVHNEASG